MGRLLRAETLEEKNTYVLDLELWPLGDGAERARRFAQIREHIESREGQVLDHVDNESMSIARIRVSGRLADDLLNMDPVASLDFPPQPSWLVANVLRISLQDLPPVPSPPENSEGVCVIDSGIASGHPLLGPAIGDRDVFPASLGSPDDGDGHGTMVAGIALYGDVGACIQQGSFVPELVIYGARVTNDKGEFDDERLVLHQMGDAIRRFASEGCRVFNVSLGDDRRPYDGGRVSPWAAVLDTLARELKVLIVLSAGNRSLPPTDHPGAARSRYPFYLLDDEARVIDPATAALGVTVGSLAGPGSPYQSQRYVDDPAYRRIAAPGQPSPFTRRGPGQQRSIKPEFCDYGGDLSYDVRRKRLLENDPGVATISLNKDYLARLFNFGSGTSFAAPKVARLAALLLGQFPAASPNLIRVLLALSADIPNETANVLQNRHDQLQVCGYGQPTFERAAYSTTSRVTLLAEDDLDIDSFHVYELPIPPVFATTRGERRVAVALAYDPPVRHSRVDYLGIRMSFRLVRGKSLEEVEEAYRRRRADEEHPLSLAGSKYQSTLWPGPTDRDRGTLQKGTLVMRNNPSPEYGETYFLVVRAERSWAREEVTHQSYAIGVLEEHLGAPIDLYTQVRQRTVVSVRARVVP